MFVELGIQHAMRMHYIFICGVRLYHIFPHYLIQGTVLGEKCTEQEVCAFSLQFLSGWFLILRRNERDMLKKFRYRSSRKVTVIAVRL